MTLKCKFSLQPFLKEAEVGRLAEIPVNDSKGPTEATEAALHEAQLEDALPAEVKLAAGKQKNTRRQKKRDQRSGEVAKRTFVVRERPQHYY